ncbi:MAG: hypothetical protein JO072_08180 [Parafilimonas sp.]|nr:hypothetical protein [Parafilimonas sp.]
MSKKHSKKQAPIYYRVSIHGQTAIKKSTGYIVDINLWDTKNKLVKPKHPKASEINNALSRLREQLYSVYSNLQKNGSVLISAIPILLKEQKSDCSSLINIYNEFINHIKIRRIMRKEQSNIINLFFSFCEFALLMPLKQ